MELPDPEWRLFRPEVGGGTGVLLLAGSSGRVDGQRAAVVARQGATVLAIRWFGGPGQQPGPYGVPLELVVDALDLLAPECDRLALMGTSFGAEACLLVASLDDRVAATVAFAPSAHVWSGYGDDRWTSHWTWRREPLPAVPFLLEWEPDSDPPAYRGLYAASLAAVDPATVAAATIPVERIAGSLVLVAGGDDQVWPAADFAAAIAARRDLHGLATVVVTHPTPATGPCCQESPWSKPASECSAEARSRVTGRWVNWHGRRSWITSFRPADRGSIRRRKRSAGPVPADRSGPRRGRTGRR